MGRTDRFRQQHAEMVGMVGQISKLLNVAALTADASQVSGLLSTLIGTLKIHLAMEDEGLYPSLLKDNDPAVKAMASKFMTEMGSIRPVVEAFAKKWGTSRAIQANAAAFVEETKGIFAALAARIEKENNELYTLADKLSVKAAA